MQIPLELRNERSELGTDCREEDCEQGRSKKGQGISVLFSTPESNQNFRMRNREEEI
jgi:hypothetical protein